MPVAEVGAAPSAAPDAPAAPATPEVTPGAAPDSGTPPSEPPAAPPSEPPAEPNLEQEPPAEEKPAAEPAPAPEEDAEPAPADEELAEVYRQHPELKEIFKANPQLRAPWFRALEINKIFPTVEDAGRAKDWAMQLYNFDTQYFGNESGKREFLNALWKNSLDENKQSTGHYEQLAGIITGDALGNLEQIVQRDLSIAQAAGLNPDQARLAIRYVKAMLGLGEARAVQPAASAAGAPARGAGQDPREAEISRREAEIARREEALRGSNEQQFTESLKTEFNGWLNTEVDKRIKPATGLAAMPPGFSSWVKKTIAERVGDALRGDDFFAAQVEALVRSGNRSPEHSSSIRTELERRARQVLPNIVRDVLSEAGVQAKAAQDAKNSRNDAAASRREPTTTAAPGRLSGPRPTPKMTGDYNRDANKILGIE